MQLEGCFTSKLQMASGLSLYLFYSISQQQQQHGQSLMQLQTFKAERAVTLEMSITHLADKGKGLPPHPLGTVAESNSELVDEVQAKVISPASIKLLQDLHHLRTRELTSESLRKKIHTFFFLCSSSKRKRQSIFSTIMNLSLLHKQELGGTGFPSVNLSTVLCPWR